MIAAPAPVDEYASRTPVVIAVPAGFGVWCTLSDACSRSEPRFSTRQTKALFARSRQRVTRAELKMNAETEKLLDIVAEPLYTDNEVLVSEFIPNVSDDREKFQLIQAASKRSRLSMRPLAPSRSRALRPM